MKYIRHFPLAFWALICLALGSVIAYSQVSDTPSAPTRSSTYATPSEERGNVMVLLNHLATVHASAAPPASGLAQWGADTAAIAQNYADNRAAATDDAVAQAYRDVAAAASGLMSVDPGNREQVLAGIAALGAAGNRLGAAVSGTSLRSPELQNPLSRGVPTTSSGSSQSVPSEGETSGATGDSTTPSMSVKTTRDQGGVQ
jgi:hypothetical protein